MVQGCAGGTEYPRWWHRQWGQQQFCSVLKQFCSVFKLDKFNMPCSVLPWQAAWQNHYNASTGAKIWRFGTLKNFDFLCNPLVPEFFAILAKIYCPIFGDAIGTNELNNVLRAFDVGSSDFDIATYVVYTLNSSSALVSNTNIPCRSSYHHTLCEILSLFWAGDMKDSVASRISK